MDNLDMARYTAYALLKEGLKDFKSSCCNKPLGFVVILFECNKATSCGNINRVATLGIVEDWVKSEIERLKLDVTH